MLIDDIDFADLYRKQLQLANRTEKSRSTGINVRKNGGELRLINRQLFATAVGENRPARSGVAV